MVSGFVTSPYDQERICSGDARPIFIDSKTLNSIYAILSFHPKLELVVDAVKQIVIGAFKLIIVAGREEVVLFPVFVLDGIAVEIAVRCDVFFIKDLIARGETHIIVIVEALAQVNLLVVLIQYLDVEAECLQFLDKNAEGFRNARASARSGP